MSLKVSAPSAWSAAVTTHKYLLTHQHLPPLPGPVPVAAVDPGEYVVAVFDSRAGMTYARWAGTTVLYSEPSAVVIGSPQFVAGYTLGALAIRSYTRRRARREAVPRWWPTQLRRAVVTTSRLWCQLAEPGRPSSWVNLAYGDVTQMSLTGTALVACLEPDMPLRLAGDWAPWCAAVIAHYRFGPMVGIAIPSLHQAAFGTGTARQR